MRISALILLVVASFAVPSGHLCAQDFITDYFKNVPRSYSSDDPWIMGKILTKEVGHGGYFYNCDSEQCKRNSPYISWNRQSSECAPNRPVKRSIYQQLDEVKRRIAWGGCGASCPQQCNGGSHCNSGGRCVSGLQAIVPRRVARSVPIQYSTNSGCTGGTDCGCSSCLSNIVPAQNSYEAKPAAAGGILANFKLNRKGKQRQDLEEQIARAKATGISNIPITANSVGDMNQQSKIASRDASRRVIEKLLQQRNSAVPRLARQNQLRTDSKNEKSAKASDNEFRMIR